MAPETPETNPTISLITLGHIDHGKSTTLGHFLVDIGAVDQRMMEKLTAESQELKRESWKYAFVLDSTDEERAGGITADIAFQPFSTDADHNFMLIDAPGHRDYVKNAIRGAVLADACLFVVSAIQSDLRSGIKTGEPGSPGGQTREHSILGSVLGINQIVFLVNKMDAVDYSEEAYKEAVRTVAELLREIQSPWVKILGEASFIPVSGLEGENLTEPSDNMPWWKGDTVSTALSKFKPTDKSAEKSRFLVHDAFEMQGIGTVLHGRLISGVIRPEDSMVVLPSELEADVKEVWDTSAGTIPQLRAGDYGIIQLRGVDKDDVTAGMIIADHTSPPKAPQSIITRLLILTSASRPLIPGSTVILHVGLSHTAARVERIIEVERSKKKRRDGQRIMMAHPGELVRMELKPDLPIIVEKFTDQPILGRAVLRKEGSTIAVGQVVDLS